MAYRSQEFCCLFSLASLQHAMSQTPSIASKIHHDVWLTSTSFSSIPLCLSTLPQFYFYPTPLLLCKDSFSVMLYWFFGNFIPHTLILLICQALYIHISFLHYVPTNKLQTKLNKTTTTKKPTYQQFFFHPHAIGSCSVSCSIPVLSKQSHLQNVHCNQWLVCFKASGTPLSLGPHWNSLWIVCCCPKPWRSCSYYSAVPSSRS